MEIQIKPRPQIDLTQVESSQLHAIGHHSETNTLAIQFKGKGGVPGSIYHYENFTVEDFEQLKSAESKGSHFKRHVKAFVDKYPYTKIQ